MMNLYIMLGLFRSHIPVTGLHGRIKIDYYIEVENKYRPWSDAKCFDVTLFSIAIYTEFILAMILILYK
jgi:hypothetical protein